MINKNAKNIVIIGDGEMAQSLCSFPWVVGYVKPDQMDVLYNTRSKNIESVDPSKHFGVIGIANPLYKKESTERWLRTGNKLGILIHPSAVILGNPEIGEGTAIFPFAMVDDASKIGRSAFIGGHTVIHKSTVEDYAHITHGCQLIMSKVEEGAILGSNSTVLDCRTVGKYSIVGAGAIVHKDIPAFHKMIQKVTEKLDPVSKIEWTENYFLKKRKFGSVDLDTAE